MLLALQGFEDARPPRWATVLLMAEAWSTPPWVLAPDAHKGSAWWAVRWATLRALRAIASGDAADDEDTDDG